VLPVPLLPRPHDIQYITIQKFEVGEMFIVFERSILCSPKLNLFDQEMYLAIEPFWHVGLYKIE